MGFELDRLMRQYGVATPTLPAEAAPEYAEAYQRRLEQTPMYLQQQFQPGESTAAPVTTFSTAQRYAVSGANPNMNLDAMNRNIRDWFAANPGATEAQIRAAQQEWGVSDLDIRNAIGSARPRGSTAYRYATGLGGIGLPAMNENIRRYFAQNPNATPADIAAEQARWGTSNEDIYRATGSYWGRALTPTWAGGADPLDPTRPRVGPPLPTPAPTPAPTPRPTPAPTPAPATYQSTPEQQFSRFGFTMPANWNSITDPMERIRILNSMGVTSGQLGALGYSPADIAWMEARGFGNPPAYTGVSREYDEPVGPPQQQPETQAASYTPSPAPAPLPTSPNVTATPQQQFSAVGVTMPGDWNTRTPQQKISYLNQESITPQHLQYLGYSPGDIQWMVNNGLNAAGWQGSANFAKGGVVEFNKGGLNDADQQAGFDELAERYNTPLPPEPELPAAPAQPGVAAAAQPMDLNAMLAKYMQPGASSYGTELTQARQRAQAETEAFNKMLQDAIKGSGEGGGPSKSEMYFRLAAAFADPGKTGSFGEGLGRAAGAMAEQQKVEREAQRAAARKKLQLGLTAQQARMTGAREDVSSLRQLAGEELKDKRAITAELLKEWTKRNDPVSTAGKQAQDEGLVPGTPQFQARVREISELAVEKANAQIQATVAGMSVAAANLALGQARFTQQQTEARRLTPGEVKLKTETEDSVAAADSAMRALKQAYQLNPNTFDASLPDMAQRKILEAAGSKDPKLVATRTMENLLAGQALEQLKTTFGAAPTEGERKILLDLQGIGAKSKGERAIIMRNAFKSLQSARERHQKRLNEINQGLYRDVGTPAAGGLE
jgi:hypothetical protein